MAAAGFEPGSTTSETYTLPFCYAGVMKYKGENLVFIHNPCSKLKSLYTIILRIQILKNENL